MEIKPKTLVGMIGRRFIRDHRDELLKLLGLDENESIKTIKLALKAQVTVTTLRTKLRLPAGTSLPKIAEAVKEYAQLQKELKAWNIKPNGNEDDEQDKLNRAMYIAAMNP